MKKIISGNITNSIKKGEIDFSILGYIAIWVVYTNFYDIQYTTHRITWFLLIGIAYFATMCIYEQTKEKLPQRIHGLVKNAIQFGILIIATIFVFRKNASLISAIQRTIPGAGDVAPGIICAAMILVNILIMEILLYVPCAVSFLKDVGSNYLLIMLVQPFLHYVAKIWGWGYYPFLGVYRVLLVIALTNILGYWIRKIIKNECLFRSINAFSSELGKNVFYALFMCSLFLMMCQNTSAASLLIYEHPIYDTVIRLALMIAFCMFSVNYCQMPNRLVANLLLFVAVSTTIYYVTCGEVFIYAVYVFAVGAVGLNDKMMVKLALFASVMSLLTVAILSMVGVYPDTVNFQSFAVIHNFGYGNENWISMQITSIILMFIYVRDHKENIDKAINFLVVLGMLYFEKKYTGGRTAIYGAIYVFAGMVVYYLAGDINKLIKKNNEKLIFWFNLIYSEMVLIGSIGFSFVVSWFYYDERFAGVLGIIYKIPALRSTMARFDSSYRGVHEFAPKLFGQIIIENNTSDGFFWLDTLYVRQLLKQGIVLFLCFFVLLTILNVKLCRRKRYFQAYAISSIPLMGIFEALVGDPMYNVFTMIALADFGSLQEQNINEKKTEERLFVLLSSLSVLFILPKAVSNLKTLFDGRVIECDGNGEMLFMIVLVSLIVIYGADLFASRIITDFISYRKIIVSKELKIFTGLGIAFLTEMATCFFMISNMDDMESSRITEEGEVISYIRENSNGRVYTLSKPEIYIRHFPWLESYIFNPEGLGLDKNVTMIADSCFDSYPLFSKGFLYMELSDESAIYTNDEQLFRDLKTKGEHITGYYSKKCMVDMSYLAALNSLPMSDDGLIMLSEGNQISVGPDVYLYGGKLKAEYSLKIDQDTFEEDYKICTLVISDNDAEREYARVAVYRSEFDDTGELIKEVGFSARSAKYAFKVLMEDGCECQLKAITYLRMPDYDQFMRVDNDGNISYAEYYDLDGNPLEMKEGYYAAEFAYDKWKNRVLSRYLGENLEPIAINTGYSEEHRVFDDSSNMLEASYFGVDGEPVLYNEAYWRIVRVYNDDRQWTHEEYHDIDDKLRLQSSGNAAIDRIFDENGNVTDHIYLDDKLKPVMITSGYAHLKREFDENKRIIREEYYDSDGKPVALAAGQAAVEYAYDENGNKTLEKYYGEDGSPVLYNQTYCSVRREYSVKNQNILEQFFDVDDKPVTLSDGASGYKREYDANNNIVKLVYLDGNGNATTNTSNYSSWERIFNEKNLIIKEMYFDEQGSSIALAQGQAAVEYDYDSRNNRILTKFYDVNGNPVLYNGAYCYVKVTYNDKNQNVLEEYFGTDDAPVLLGDAAHGYAREYDDAGNVSRLTYLGADGKPTLNTSNYSTWKKQYNDKKQNVLEEYFGVDGEPILLSDGASAYKREYDENGNVITLIYLGTDGNPVLNVDSYSQVDFTYDENNTLIKKTFKDLQGNIVDEQVVE